MYCLVKYAVHSSVHVMLSILCILFAATTATEERPNVPVIVSSPFNMTTLVHRSPVVLPCSVDGEPTPKVTWQQRRAADEPWRNVRRHLAGRIQHANGGQKLEIHKLLVSDAGFYRCAARNSHGTAYSNPAYLNIQAAAEIIELSPQYVNGSVVLYGTHLVLRCTAVGRPLPSITWTANGQVVWNTDVSSSSPVHQHAHLRINATNSAVFECIAQNDHVEGHTRVAASTSVVVMEDLTGNTIDNQQQNTSVVRAQAQTDTPDLVPIIIAMVAIATMTVIAMLAAVVCWRACHLRLVTVGNHRCDNEAGVITKQPIRTPSDFDVDVEQLPCNDGYYQISTMFIDSIFQSLEYRRNDLCYLRDIGHGAFGQIFVARATNIANQSSTEVAVKVLDGDDPEMERDFLRSASVLAELTAHPNIVRLLGVCFAARPLCVVLEYADAGDLHHFLRDSAPSHFIERRGRENCSARLTPGQQIEICRQIASGMLHIAQSCFVHRDLAARNCLVSVTHKLEVKVADFGLARRLPAGIDFYEGTDVEEIAVRWAATEAIVDGRFSIATDVWSFGVTAWEVFSFAARPYGDLESTAEVVKRVVGGRTLDRPDAAPNCVYDLMVSCWNADPTKRPQFGEIVTSLTTLKHKLKH